MSALNVSPLQVIKLMARSKSAWALRNKWFAGDATSKAAVASADIDPESMIDMMRLLCTMLFCDIMRVKPDAFMAQRILQALIEQEADRAWANAQEKKNFNDFMKQLTDFYEKSNQKQRTALGNSIHNAIASFKNSDEPTELFSLFLKLRFDALRLQALEVLMQLELFAPGEAIQITLNNQHLQFGPVRFKVDANTQALRLESTVLGRNGVARPITVEADIIPNEHFEPVLSLGPSLSAVASNHNMDEVTAQIGLTAATAVRYLKHAGMANSPLPALSVALNVAHAHVHLLKSAMVALAELHLASEIVQDIRNMFHQHSAPAPSHFPPGMACLMFDCYKQQVRQRGPGHGLNDDGDLQNAPFRVGTPRPF